MSSIMNIIKNTIATLCLATSIAILLVGCETPDPFSIRVTDLEGNPLESVRIDGVSGEVSYGALIGTWSRPPSPATYLTGPDGWVEIAGSNKHRSCYFYLTNYHPLSAGAIPDYTYKLTPTSAKLRPLKTLNGNFHAFIDDGIVSLSDGNYIYSDTDGNQITSLFNLCPSQIKSYHFNDDFLWVKHDSLSFTLIGLTDPTNPTATTIPSQPIEGRIVAASTTKLLMNDYYSNPKLYYLLGDSIVFASQIRLGSDLNGATIRGEKLYLTHSYNWYLYDISDPTVPTLSSNHPGDGSIVFQDSLFFMRKFIGRSIPCLYDIYRFDRDGVAFLNNVIETHTPLEILIDKDHALLRNETNRNGYFCAERTTGTGTFVSRGFSLNPPTSIRANRALFSNELYSWE